MKNTTLFSFRVIATVSLLLILGACKTTKNSAMHRGWHNMNSRYNGYFYARENNKEAILKVEKENKDDFSKLLPMFIYPTNETAKNYVADFDKTIKKSSTVIQRHAITNKNKEEIPNACRWIDENYMLIGKAHLYKRDLFPALEVFTYVAQTYPNPPAKYLGMIWMVRTNNEIGSLSLSEPIIDEMRNAEDFPKKKKYRSYKRELTAVTADYYIKRLDYPQAIKYLEEAIVLTKKKPIKARYIFILAQLYEKMGDNKNASMYYGKVPGMHPSYDMAFNAKINQAKLYDTEMGDSKAMKKELMKMMHDDKNIEYLDQIYYALAQIVYKEKDIPLALDYLDKSIQNSVSNPTQKALSFLKRADIYFEKTNYPTAEANYDSAITFLPKDYPDYSTIETKKNSLTALVINLNVITLEDSLQGLSKMTEKERNKAVEAMIVKLEREEKRKEEERQRMLANQAQNAQNPISVPVSASSSSGAWYFYNPTTVSFGVMEFTKKWGSRKLENNWRRSEKEQEVSNVAADDQGDPTDTVAMKADSVAKTAGTSTIKDKAFYLSNIPATSDAITASNNKIIEAYYNVGSIYKEQLLNNQRSVETFEELLKRYPDNKYKQSTYYQLYRTYLTMNNQPKAEYYKNLLLNNYPDSEYSKIIKNPEYGKDVMASKSQIEKFYAETYQLYLDGKYAETIDKCSTADTLYSKNYLMPQFDFLKALSIGKTQDINALENELTKVVIKHPKSPVKEKAQEILDLIKIQKTKAANAVIPADTTRSKFIFKEEGSYYWMVILENNKGDLNKLKTKLIDLNTKHFKDQGLTTSISALDETHLFINVKIFDGRSKAMDYYNFLKANKDVFADLQAGAFQYFIISLENYALFYKDKNIADYQQFFDQNFH